MSTSATTGGHDGDGPAGAVDPLLDPALDPDLDAELDAAARGTTEVVAPARRRALGLALAVISTAQLMVVLDATIVNIALPTLGTDLGFSQANLSWVVNAYTLAFGGLLLLGGRAGDLLGRRKTFMAGVGVFALASFLGGVAQSEGQLIGARILQGLGAAIASPTALSLVTTTFPAGPARNRAFAVYAAMSGAGAAIGLILGGVLTEIDWRWTFFVNVPIGIAVIILAPMVLPESARQRGRFDLPGAVTATAGLVSLVYGLTQAAEKGWGTTATLLYLSAGVALIVAFLVIESRSSHALMPFRVLAQRDRAASYLAMLVVGAGMFALFYFLGIYIQTVLGYSPVRAGVSFLPFSAGIIAAAQLGSYLVSRVDARWISGPGALIAAAGMLWMAQITPQTEYVTGLLGPMVTMAFGLGLIFVPLTLTAVAGVEKRDAGVASAVLNTMQQVGGAIGLATLSTVASRSSASKATELAADLQAKAAAGLPADQLAQLKALVPVEAFTSGATAAFVVAAAMILGAGLLVVSFLRVRHEDLATDQVQVTTH
jgi:EmrB/QacA subfamily drug resistance transporter